MQPLSLQNGSMLGRTTSTNLGVAGTGIRQFDATPVGNTGGATGGGQFDMMSLIVPLLQLMQAVIGMAMGGGFGASNTGAAGNAGAAGNTGAAGNAGAAGNTGAVGNNSVGGVTDPAAAAAASNPNTADLANGIGNASGMTINDKRNLNYSDLRADAAGGEDYANVRGGKQAFNGVSGTEAAIMHLGGRGHISGGTSETGVAGSTLIYNNVLNNPGKFTPDEVALIEQYATDEKSRYGYVTGENLDHAFVEQMAARGDIAPEKLAQYHQAINARVAKMTSNPNQAAIAQEASGEVNIVDNLDTLQGQSGLTPYEQAVYRLSGHSTLFSGDGSINGDILAVTLGNKNSLDGRGDANANSNIDAQTLSLLQDDLASDGELNGDSLRYANEKVLDKVFMGGPGVTENDVRTNAVQQGQVNGRSQQDIMSSLQLSANDAIQQFGDFVSKHPVITAMGAGAMGAAAGVCPFLSGTMAVGAGMAAGSKMLSNDATASGGGGGGY